MGILIFNRILFLIFSGTFCLRLLSSPSSVQLCCQSCPINQRTLFLSVCSRVLLGSSFDLSFFFFTVSLDTLDFIQESTTQKTVIALLNNRTDADGVFCFVFLNCFCFLKKNKRNLSVSWFHHLNFSCFIFVSSIFWVGRCTKGALDFLTCKLCLLLTPFHLF